MSLEKAIEHGKEHRKPWWGPWGLYDHDDCYLQASREHKRRKAELAADEQIREFRDPRPANQPIHCSPKQAFWPVVEIIITPEQIKMLNEWKED